MYYWHGEHVKLRIPCDSDFELKYQEFLDTETRRLLQCTVETPLTIDVYKDKLIKFYDQEDVLALHIENNNNELVGWINLFLEDKKNGVCSISFGIFKDFRKKGYAYEAATIMLDYAFNELRFQKCNSACLDQNVASKQLHLKLRFKVEGKRRRTVYMDGVYWDEVLFGITKEEFNEK